MKKMHPQDITCDAWVTLLRREIEFRHPVQSGLEILYLGPDTLHVLSLHTQHYIPSAFAEHVKPHLHQSLSVYAIYATQVVCDVIQTIGIWRVSDASHDASEVFSITIQDGKKVYKQHMDQEETWRRYFSPHA